MSGPSAEMAPPVADQSAIERVRAGPGAQSAVMSASVVGYAMDLFDRWPGEKYADHARNNRELQGILRDIFHSKTSAEWIEFGDEHNTPIAPCNSPKTIMNAQRAYELGMISQIVDPPEQLREEAQKLAETVALNSPTAMRHTKKALWGALEAGLTDACKNGAQHLVAMWGHPDQEEGPAAFAEKREANWQPLSTDA